MKDISVIGGDNVTKYLIGELLEDGNYNIITCGLEKLEDMNGVKKVDLDTALSCDTIIFSIPFLNSSNMLFTPFSFDKISYDDIRENLDGKTIITSRVPEDILKDLEDKSVKVIDVSKTEELNIINAISTAEGVLVLAIGDTDYCLFGSDVLVLGFGRVGKMICKLFKGVGAKVSCEARNTKDLTWIAAHGYNPIDLKDLDSHLKDYNIIVNTVPSMILDEKRLDNVSKNTLLIDIASEPRGIDTEYAKKIGLNAKWVLSIPSKVAPKTYAEGIKQVMEIYEI